MLVQCKTKTKRQQPKGCSFKSKTYKVKKATRKLDLHKPFRDTKVPVGTKITITITAPGFTGKRFTYVMRPNKAPKLPKPVHPDQRQAGRLPELSDALFQKPALRRRGRLG